MNLNLKFIIFILIGEILTTKLLDRKIKAKKNEVIKTIIKFDG
jgi:hypothetical protein